MNLKWFVLDWTTTNAFGEHCWQWRSSHWVSRLQVVGERPPGGRLHFARSRSNCGSTLLPGIWSSELIQKDEWAINSINNLRFGVCGKRIRTWTSLSHTTTTAQGDTGLDIFWYVYQDFLGVFSSTYNISEMLITGQSTPSIQRDRLGTGAQH
jgi:hypothetical protein